MSDDRECYACTCEATEIIRVCSFCKRSIRKHLAPCINCEGGD